MSLTTTTDEPKGHDRFMQAIAIFKFLKAILFVLAALGAFGLMQQGLADRAREWGSALAFTSGQHIVRRGIMFVTGLSRQKIGALGLVALFYAALFATEGVGLWREKRWAEYLTVVATGSLIPLEVWEMVHRPTPVKFATFVINVAVVVYLIVRLRRPRGAHAARAAAPNAGRAAKAATTEPERSIAG
jgi:uncharacterized membrane protein (DUF2068 family)